MKKVIILDHNGGRLCNQLLNYVSVYAYCLEKGFCCRNYSFYKYDGYFDFPDKNLVYRLFLACDALIRRIGKRWIVHWLYRKYITLIGITHPSGIINSGKSLTETGPIYLPPTPPKNCAYTNELTLLAHTVAPTYLKGWLFRNPIGLEKHREQIRKYFTPAQPIKEKTENFIEKLRARYDQLIGVHIRQGDYRGDIKGAMSSAQKIYFNEQQVSDHLRDYMAYTQKDPQKICFMICSDDPVDLSPFRGLTVIPGPGGVMEDLYALSLTDMIIGSNSTFGAYASYYGNIPFIVLERGRIDWDFYKDKKSYFENDKCKVACY